MKVSIIGVLLFFVYSLLLQAAQPNDSHSDVSLDISLKALTLAYFPSESVWYSTLMPGFKAHYTYNLQDKNNHLHKFSGSIKYFESNTFKLNSAELEKGAMRLLLLDFNLGYLTHIPVIENIDFITGVSIALQYLNIGHIIAIDTTRIMENYTFALGPACGFSIYAADILDLSSIVYLHAGLPISGTILYPDGFIDKLNIFSCSAAVKNSLTLYLKDFYLGTGYDFSLTGYVGFNKNSEAPIIESFLYSISHSLIFKAGFLY